MAARRRKRLKTSGWSHDVALSQDGAVEPAADFFPPGFSTEVSPESANGETTTYFLHTEKRGLSRYVPMLTKHYQKGFRAVVVTQSKLIFDRANARIVGRLSGDFFEEAVKWAKRNVLDELQLRYVTQGGGTMREREKTVRRFFRSIRAREELEKKRLLAEAEFEQASIEMVLRFGKKPFVLPRGASGPGGELTFDACCGPGDKVYWRSRNGKLPERGQ